MTAAPKRTARSKKVKPDQGSFIVGRHVNTTDGFSTVPWFSQSTGCTVAQIFLGGSKNFIRTRKSQADVDAFRAEAQSRNITVVVHASLLINLSRQQDNSIWTRSVDCLVADVQCCTDIGGIGVVVHLGCAVGQSIADAETNYIAGIRAVLARTPGCVPVIIETSAHEGSEIAHNIIDLARLYHYFTTTEQARIKFCIDTCHVFAAGYPLSADWEVDVFLDCWDALIGLDRIMCIHMNDSKCACGSRRDRHDDIGSGMIWKHNKSGLRRLCQEAYRRSIPLILETPSTTVPSIYQMALLRFLLFNNTCDDVRVDITGTVWCTGIAQPTAVVKSSHTVGKR